MRCHDIPEKKKKKNRSHLNWTEKVARVSDVVLKQNEGRKTRGLTLSTKLNPSPASFNRYMKICDVKTRRIPSVGCEEGSRRRQETHSRADVTQSTEHDDTSQEDLPTLEVELVERRRPDSNEDPVGGGHESGDGDSVVGRDVGGDGNFGVDRDVGPDESVVERGDGSLLVPFLEGVEEKLAGSRNRMGGGECELRRWEDRDEEER